MEVLRNINTGSEREVVLFRTDLDNSQINVEFVRPLLESCNYELIVKEEE